MEILKDPVIFLSYINTQLRDHYTSLNGLCRALDLDENSVRAKLLAIEYEYDEKQNQFI